MDKQQIIEILKRNTKIKFLGEQEDYLLRESGYEQIADEILKLAFNLPVIGSLACPNCKSELQLKIEPITNSDILNAIKANDR
jgi:hypothetical protein